MILMPVEQGTLKREHLPTKVLQKILLLLLIECQSPPPPLTIGFNNQLGLPLSFNILRLAFSYSYGKVYMLWVAYSILSRESWFIFRMGTEKIVAMGSLVNTRYFREKVGSFFVWVRKMLWLWVAYQSFARKLVYIRMGTNSILLWEAFVKLVCASRF